MKRLAVVFAVGILVALPRDAVADFAAGVRAYDTGDYEAAYLEWLPLAEDGDPAAQRNIGHLYRKGLGTTPDLVKAAQWYRRAAELGFARAQANLASMYRRGDGVPQDYAEAAKWFERAGHQGHVIAQFNLALMYERGLGVPQSEPKAFAWYYNAARAGHKKAAARLGTLVLPGAAGPEVSEEMSAVAAPTSTTTGTSDETSAATSGDATLPRPSTDRPSSESGADESSSAVPASPSLAVTPAAGEPDSETADAETLSPAAERSTTVAASAPSPPHETLSSEVVGSSAPTKEEIATGEQGESRGGSSVLRFIFSFNNQHLVARGDERDYWRNTSGRPAPSDAADESPLKEATVAPPAIAEPNAPSRPVALDAQTETETVADNVSEGSAEVSNVTDESEQATVAFSVLRWVVRAGAQTSGNLTSQRRAAPIALETDTPSAASAATDDAPTAIEQTTSGREPADVTIPDRPAEVAAASPVPHPTRFAAGQAAYDAADYEAALATWLPMARAGDSEAQYLLGRMYLEGTGVAPDPLQAYMWWTLAANQSHAKAVRSVGLLATGMTEAQIAAGEILVEDWADRR